jgi:hypothetical protein
VKAASPREPLWKFLLLGIVVLGLIELLMFGAGTFLSTFGVLYAPQSTDDYQAYLNERDPLLGWPAPSTFGTGESDMSGSRVVPAFADPADHSTCVSLFGDSFTEGVEVGPSEAYGNVLSGLLGCRVANYGVGGYGSDQAYLRFRDRVEDGSSIVVLGHLSENIVRNVNQFRGFVSGARYTLKPRFVVDDAGRLELIPLPQLTAEEFAALDRRADELVPYDFFRPGGGAGTRVLRFPFSVSVLGVFADPRLRQRLRGMPGWPEYYQPDHPSGGLDVSSKILQAFHRDALARGQQPIVLLIPTLTDLLALRETGALPYQSLERELERVGIATPHVAERLLAGLGDRDPCDLYKGCIIHRHFNADGNERLAAIVHQWIVDQGYWESLKPKLVTDE